MRGSVELLFIPFAHPILSIVALVALLIFSAWAARKKNGLITTFIKTFFIFHLPIFVFIYSCFLAPDNKAVCRHGWIDCFMAGKIALLPLVIWAAISLYAHDVLKRSAPPPRWVALGILTGALVSGFCSYFWIAENWSQFSTDIRNGTGGFMAWFSVPAYVAIWYVLRSHQLIRKGHLHWPDTVGILARNAPFWAWSLWLSKEHYASLPEANNGCFVVTAAGRGHRRVVGNSIPIWRDDKFRAANQQLVRFWNLEEVWHQAHPGSHRVFRKLYNVIGPPIAARIRNPWIADIVYLALKPVEVVAVLCTATHYLRERVRKGTR